MAQTFNSDLYNKKTEQSVPQETVPAQIDFCPWYLTFVQGATRQFTLIDKTLLDKVTAESFKLDAKDGSQTKVDVFSESLSGTILHEVSRSLDNFFPELFNAISTTFYLPFTDQDKVDAYKLGWPDHR